MSTHGDWYNVLAAIKQPRHADLVKNFIPLDPNDSSKGWVREALTPEERIIFGKNHGADYWHDVQIGPDTYRQMSFFVKAAPIPEPSPLAGKLDVVEAMLAKWPLDSFVVGVWKPDGSQYGTTIHPITNVVEGTAVYPLHAKFMDFLPDAVVYDSNGSELSRGRPSVWKDVVHMAGWKPRRV